MADQTDVSYTDTDAAMDQSALSYLKQEYRERFQQNDATFCTKKIAGAPVSVDDDYRKTPCINAVNPLSGSCRRLYFQQASPTNSGIQRRE